MKKALIFFFVLTACLNFAIGENGTPPCNCPSSDQVNLHAAGQAEWVNANQIKCTGQTGICWELTYSGKFILTIYTEPPIIFDNHNQPDDPPVGPYIIDTQVGYVVYEFDHSVWKRQ